MSEFLGPNAVVAVGFVIAAAMSTIMLTLGSRVWRELRHPRQTAPDAIPAREEL